MVFLLFFTRVHPPPSSPVVSHRRQPWPVFSPTTSFSINPSRVLPLKMHASNRRWDSNAETFRTRNFDGGDFEDEDEDDDDDDENQWLDILEDFIDGVWIFKVFRSFGWMLPAIISSFLLTSGPKAFLMALAIPIGQSALSFLFQTVWGRPGNKTRRRGKSKKKQPPPPRRPPGSPGYMDMDDDEQEYVERERKRAYQTWVGGDGSSDNKTNGSSSSFGGWEELDGRRARSDKGRKRKQSTSGMSRRVKRNETPFLLRLLIAVFPFLGSWTKLL